MTNLELLRDMFCAGIDELVPYKDQVPHQVTAGLGDLVDDIDQWLRHNGLSTGLERPMAPVVSPKFNYAESQPFGPGGKYERLSDALREYPWEVWPESIPILNSHHRNKNGPDEPVVFDTAKWRGRCILGNDVGVWDVKKNGLRHGPLWGARLYDLVGLVDDIRMMRIGDFTDGREGHPLYVNVCGSLKIRKLRTTQCGGNLQVVTPWERNGTTGTHDETSVPKEMWPTAQDVLELEDNEFIDNGIINEGASVRASWPQVLYAIPMRIHGFRGIVRTLEAPEFSHHGKTYRSHGSLFVGKPVPGIRTPELFWDSFISDIIAPDREDFRFEAIDLMELTGFTALRKDLDGNPVRPVIAISRSCKRVVLRDWVSDMPLRIQIHSASTPYSMAEQVIDWDGTGTKEFKF